ncbi:phage head morphogenesis protein, partial [Glaesserella parasuis]|nr:phage head morphogenesis protein [Glaesserella parasuis]
KQGKGINLPLEFWQQLPEKLRSPKAILLDSSQKLNALLFVYEEDGAKIIISMDYKVQVKNSVTKKKERIALNMVTTGTKISNAR